MTISCCFKGFLQFGAKGLPPPLIDRIHHEAATNACRNHLI
jgi:hypothetical protein